MLPLVQGLNKQLASKNEHERELFSFEFLRDFRRLAPFFKHGSFIEEAEVRICILPEMVNSLKVHNHDSVQKKVVKIDLFNSPEGMSTTLIEEIIVGPCGDYNKKMLELQGLLESMKYDWKTILFCGIPHSFP